MLALVLLGSTVPALGSGRDILADAEDTRIDNCYTRAEFREALRLARDDQRLYAFAIDVITEAQITHVTRRGTPCGSASAVPATPVTPGGSGAPGLWLGVLAAVGVVSAGAGAWVHRRGRDA